MSFYLGSTKIGQIKFNSNAVLDSINVTPSTSTQTITPTSGTDGFNTVNVSAVTSSIDSNIQADNIKEGVTILGVNGTLPDYSDEINITLNNNIVTFKHINNSWIFSELYNSNINTLQSNCFSILCPEKINTPNVTIVNNSALANSNIKYITVGTVSTWSGVFGTIDLPNLRKLTVGEGTNVGLGMTLWTATNVINEGQTGIDELNYNIITGLANNLYDRQGLSALTIRFSSNIYNILTSETKAAFTSKNWNISYA